MSDLWVVQRWKRAQESLLVAIAIAPGGRGRGRVAVAAPAGLPVGHFTQSGLAVPPAGLAAVLAPVTILRGGAAPVVRAVVAVPHGLLHAAGRHLADPVVDGVVVRAVVVPAEVKAGAHDAGLAPVERAMLRVHVAAPVVVTEVAVSAGRAAAGVAGSTPKAALARAPSFVWWPILVSLSKQVLISCTLLEDFG